MSSKDYFLQVGSFSLCTSQHILLQTTRVYPYQQYIPRPQYDTPLLSILGLRSLHLFQKRRPPPQSSRLAILHVKLPPRQAPSRSERFPLARHQVLRLLGPTRPRTALTRALTCHLRRISLPQSSKSTLPSPRKPYRCILYIYES